MITAQKISFPLRISSVNVKKFFILLHLLKKALMENFIFCAVGKRVKLTNSILLNSNLQRFTVFALEIL